MRQCKCRWQIVRYKFYAVRFPYKCVWIGYGTALKINKGNFGTRHFAACFVVFFARHNKQISPCNCQQHLMRDIYKDNARRSCNETLHFLTPTQSPRTSSMIAPINWLLLKSMMISKHCVPKKLMEKWLRKIKLVLPPIKMGHNSLHWIWLIWPTSKLHQFWKFWKFWCHAAFMLIFSKHPSFLQFMMWIF